MTNETMPPSVTDLADPVEGNPIARPLLCAPCLIEQHVSSRETPNPAVTIVGGSASCAEHLVFGPAPIAPDRTPGGIVIPGMRP